MKDGFDPSFILVLGLLSWADSLSASPPPHDREPVEDFSNVDPTSLGVEPVPAEEDPRTGFVVGGEHPTALIRSITEINGRAMTRRPCFFAWSAMEDAWWWEPIRPWKKITGWPDSFPVLPDLQRPAGPQGEGMVHERHQPRDDRTLHDPQITVAS